MSLNVYSYRKALHNTLKAIQKGTLTIGFIGGSITDARPGHNWPEPVCSWFVEQFPKVRVVVENAAIGATGSDLAVFRAKRDLIDRGCDLVFIDYAVNDGGEPTGKRNNTREGLVRKLLKDGKTDLVFAYTYQQEMYKDMMSEIIPDTIKEFEVIAEHYGISSVWMGLYSLEEIKKGRMKWEEWLPDGLHPQYRGSLSYAQSIIGYLEKELINTANTSSEISLGEGLLEPLYMYNWENSHLLPFEEVKLEGPWLIRRWTTLFWIDKAITTSAVGAKLSFCFEGTGLMLGFDFGKTSSEFRYCLDGEQWTDVERDRPDWCGNSGWYRLTTIADGLFNGLHEFQLEVTHGGSAECTGTNFSLGLIGIIE